MRGSWPIDNNEFDYSEKAQFYTIYNDFFKATIYNYFASLVYILQSELGAKNILQNIPINPPPPQTETLIPLNETHMLSKL